MPTMVIMQVICSVLSLRDSCVMYPSCPQCVSRLQQSELRCSCQKCGFTSDEESISYRYRLSLCVKRYSDIFGVTVFGSCLNPYFGIPAVGLHRFFDETLKNADDPKGDFVHRLLLKAMEDCFVGRQFEFRIKLPGHETRERFLFNEQGLHTLLASSRISGEFVASQISLPNGAARGTSVLCYFKKLLHASRVFHLSGFPYLERPPAFQEQADPLAPQSFEWSLASFSRSSFWHSYNIHFSPWYAKQSPGIITSSAEQEEHIHTEIEPKITVVGLHQRSRKSHRPPKKCSCGIPSDVLSPQYCSLDVKGEVCYKDCSQGSSLGFLACCDIRETTAPSPPNTFQCHASLPDSLELISSVTEFGNHNCPKPSGVELEQYEHLRLKLGWRSLFSVGGDDTSFQKGLSVGRWNSQLSNSSAWRDLPLSESWGEFINKANTPSEVSQKNKACDSGKKSKTGYIDEICRHANNVCGATEHSCKVKTTSHLPSTVVIEQASMAVVQQPFIKSDEVCCTENGSVSENCDVKQRTLMSTSNHVVHIEDQARVRGDLTLWVPSLRAMPGQDQCNCYVQNKIKECSGVGGELKRQGRVFYNKHYISQHNLDGKGVFWDFGLEEQALPNGGPFSTDDVYNASADLFGSCENGVGSVEKENNRVTPQSQCRTLKLLKSSCLLVDAYREDCLTPIKQIPKPSTQHTMGSEISDQLDFIPFSQSTPISGNFAPLRCFSHKGKDEAPSRRVLRDNMPWHHGYSEAESEIKMENVADCGGEGTACFSMNKIKCFSKPQSLTRSKKRTEPHDRHCCKRIKFASRGKNFCRKILSSSIGNIWENNKVPKFSCVPSNYVCIRSCSMDDCAKGAHLKSEEKRLAEVVTSPECSARKNSYPLDISTSCLCTDQNSMVLDWSADLFADSFGI